MATAARVFVWAARGNRTVDVGRLCGPRSGQFVPPPYLAARVPRDEYDLADRADRDEVYRLLLCYGTAEDITRWVNPHELARSLDDLGLAEHVAAPWRQALRALGLAPEDQPVDPVPVHRCGLEGRLDGSDRAEKPDGSGGGASERRPTVPAV